MSTEKRDKEARTLIDKAMRDLCDRNKLIPPALLYPPSLPAEQVTVNRDDLADLTDAVLSRRFAGVNGPLERLRAVLNQEDK